jgi:hypothetical protein
MAASKRNSASSSFFSALVLACAVAGCSQKQIYPVHGRIVDMRGEEIKGLKGGAVEFQALDAKMSANGAIEEDGSFTLTTKHPGDGAHLGRQRIAITRPYFGPERPAPYVIAPKYEKFETSGLETTIEPHSNEILLKVELYKGKR